MSDDLLATLRAIVGRLERLGVPYMLVGSVAALAHGRSRATQDFDVVVRVDETSLRAFLADLPKDQFYVSESAALDALRRSTMFNVIDMATGWKVDLVPLKRRPFSRREFDRRTTMELLGERLFVATVEDTILAKLEWSKLGGGSTRQLEDVRELLRIHHGRLDDAYILAGIEELGVQADWSEVTK